MSILRENNRHRVTIGENVYCTCTPSQRADRKTCCHVLWVYVNLFGMEEDDNTIAQVNLDRAKLGSLYQKCPDNAPENLSKCLQKAVKRTFHPMILIHPKCDAEQTWYVQRKPGNKTSTCAGCIKKGQIMPGAVHLFVEGLLFLTKQNWIIFIICLV